MADDFGKEEKSSSSAPSSGGGNPTFADMQLAGQARPAPPGMDGQGFTYLQPIPVSGGQPPPPPLYLSPSFQRMTLGSATPPAPLNPPPSPSNPNPVPTGGQQQMASQPSSSASYSTGGSPGSEITLTNVDPADVQRTNNPETDVQRLKPSDRAPTAGSPTTSSTGQRAPLQGMSPEQWSTYTPMSELTDEEKIRWGQGDKEVAAKVQALQDKARADRNAYGMQSLFHEAADEAERSTTGFRQAGGVFRGDTPSWAPGGVTQGQSAKEYADSHLRQIGFTPDGRWLGDPSMVGSYRSPYAPQDPSQPTTGGFRNLYPQDRPGYAPTQPTNPSQMPGGGTGRPAPGSSGAPGAGSGSPGSSSTPQYSPPGMPQGPAPGPWSQVPGVVPTAFGGMSDPTLATMLQERLKNFQGYKSPVETEQVALLRQMLSGGAGGLNDDLLGRQYGMLKGRLDESYGLDQQAINETGARRGLYDSTNTVGRLRDASIQHDRAGHDMATQLLIENANRRSGDQLNAINASNAYNSQGLNAFGANEAAMSNRMNQATAYDSELFNRSLESAKFNQSQDQQAINFWLQMLGY